MPVNLTFVISRKKGRILKLRANQDCFEREMQKVVCFWVLGLSHTLPPCCLAISLTMVRPSPRPFHSSGRLMPLKQSKNPFGIFLFQPLPLSLTEKT